MRMDPIGKKYLLVKPPTTLWGGSMEGIVEIETHGNRRVSPNGEDRRTSNEHSHTSFDEDDQRKVDDIRILIQAHSDEKVSDSENFQFEDRVHSVYSSDQINRIRKREMELVGGGCLNVWGEIW